MYRPSSTVYPETNVGDDLAEKFVTTSAWDSSQPSGRAKEVRPFDRHSGPRGDKGVRDVGKYKMNECNYQKL